MRKSGRSLVAWLLGGACAAALLLVALPAAACATCGCGDPTLTAMGLEKPFRNRVRVSIEESFAGHDMGGPKDLERTLVLRSALTVSWSPLSRLTLAALVPALAVFVSSPQSDYPGYRRGAGLGDMEFMARVVLFRERAFSPRHLVTALAGLKAPTGWRVKDDLGFPLGLDDQPSSGSWDPFAGAGYAYYGDQLGFFSSASYRYTTPGWDGYRRGSSLGATAGVQVQPRTYLALAVSADLRWRDPDVQFGQAVPDTGGTLLAVTPAVLVAPAQDWLLRLAVQAPVGEFLNGNQREYPLVMLSAAADF